MSRKIFRTVFGLMLVLTQFAARITPALAAPPTNDNFADAELITALPFSASVDNTEASAEPGEPTICSTFVFRSVWYSFVATEDSAVRLASTGGGFVNLFVASGPTFSDLHSLTCVSGGSSTNFAVTAGQTYYLQADSLGQPTTVQFSLEQLNPPANDSFAHAETINALPFSATADSTDATSEAGEPYGCSSPSGSLWYSFVPSENMVVRVVVPTAGAVNVFRAAGAAISDLTSLGCSYVSTSGNFRLEMGQTYYLRLASNGQPALLGFSVEQITPPANDDFASAQPFSSLPFTANADNTNATTEPGEPTGCQMGVFRSVWYSFTPAENMALQLDMVGSQMGGTVNVFRASGPALSDLTSVACAFSFNSTNFAVEAGQTYYFRVDSFGQPGAFQFNLQQIVPPANDNFANAEAINSLPFNASVDNTNATAELGERQGSCNFPFRSVWYSFTPTETMALRVNLSSQMSSSMEVFRSSGPGISDLTSLGCAFNNGTSINFRLEAGQTYYLRVDSSGQAGVVQINLEQVSPPANDDFANAESINALPFNASVDNTNATLELGEPAGCQMTALTGVWYSFTPAQNMSVRVSLPSQGSVNIFLASGTSFADLTSLTCISGGNPSNFQIQGGQAYYFRVDSYFGQTGVLQFSLEQIFPPANDSYANAEAIGSLPYNVTVDNSNATTEPGEPYGCFLNRSVWYSFTAAESMAVRVSLAGSTIPGYVNIFLSTGPSLSDVSLLTCAGSSSPTIFQVEAGQTYYLRLDSFGQAGLLQLNLAKLNPPVNDNFANATSITSIPFNTSVDITDAGTEPNESHYCYFMPNTVWYAFTPAETMTLRANTLGSPINGNVDVYRSSGTGISGLQFLTCSGPGGSPSFLAEAGQTYYLRVGAAFGESGTVNVNLVPTIPPVNDNFADAVHVTSLPFNATVDITDATNEPNEPQYCNYSPNTAWYSFTPAETIKVRADTQGGALPGNISIYQALDSGFPNLQFIQCTGFGGATSFLAQAGETYYLQVGGNGQPGTIQINLAEMPTISGRATDAVTGTPLPGNASPFAIVTLERDSCGGDCFEFVNSQMADGAGRFYFDSYYYGTPLPVGTYRLQVGANSYLTTPFGPFEFTGTNLDLGDVPVSPPSNIHGRAVDAETGNPLSGIYVELHRCFDGACYDFVNSQYTDSNGLFQFNSFSYGPPLPGGTYRLYFSHSVYEPKQIDFSISDGEDRDVGDVALTPLPLIGSISGKLIDTVTGQPVSQAFASAGLYRCSDGSCEQFVTTQTPDSLGRFQFNTDYYGNPIPTGTFQIRAYADQYYEYQGDPFTVGEGENKNVGNVRLTSYPVRFSEMQACNAIPATGGDCVYSIKITNGQPTKLEGLAWSLVSSYLPESFAGNTDFRAGDNQGLSLAPGKSKILQFRFTVPANQSSYGSFICTRIFIGQGNNPLLTTIGYRSLFCVTRNANGFSVASPADMVSIPQASITASTGSELEPNNSCQSAQDLSAAQYPFVLDGALDSSQSPDVDYYRFTGTPGSLVAIDLEGWATGKGTLFDPYLGYFDSNCDLLATNDDSSSLNSRLEVTVPSDGVFVMAATQCCDSGFFGGGNGSYQLTVSPVQTIGSITGVITDAVSGLPLRGDAVPFASVQLLQSTQFGWNYVNSQLAGADGRFNFSSDSNGAPLRVGDYAVIAHADQYQTYQTQSFSVGEGENHDLGSVPLTSFPVRFSEVQPCAVPTDGAICEFSVKITNGLATRLSGQAWSIIIGESLGTFAAFSHFQTDVPLGVSLDPGQSKVLTFRFRVRASVPDGAYMCARIYVGQSPSALFNTVGQNFLFCFVKGSNGLTLMSAQEMHQKLLHEKILEVEPKNLPSAKK